MDAASEALDKFAMTIGHVTIRYNEAQMMVLRIFCNLSGMDMNLSRTLFFNIKSDTAQRELTAALAKAVMTEQEEDCNEVVKAIERLSSLSGERNAAIHTMWYLDGDGETEETAAYWMIPDPSSIPHKKLKDDPLQQFVELMQKLDDARDQLFMAFMKTVGFFHHQK